MSNLFWYICLAVIGVGIGFVSIVQNRHKYKVSTLIVFYLFVAGATWIGEFIVLGLFNSYAYKTGVFKSPWAQNLLGHLILNTTLYPAVVIAMVAYSLRYGWMALVTAFFVLVEFLFQKLGIYEQHWWRYYITALNVILVLAVSSYWFPRVLYKPYGSTRAITFYFIAMLIVHIPAPVLLLLGKQHYQIGLVNHLFYDMYLSSTIVIFLYHLVESFLLVLCTCILKKWYWTIVPFVISITVQSTLAGTGILVMDHGWKLFYTIVIYEIFIASFITIEKNTLRPGSFST